YADGGSLWDLVESSLRGRVSEADLRWWTQQIVSAIQWCHSQGFAHRDIKSHNFILTPTSHLLLIDFGSAAPLLPPTSTGVQLVPKEYCTVPCGTCDYISPEILECHEAALIIMELEEQDLYFSEIVPDYDEKRCYCHETDCWGFSAMMYEMAYDVAPF
ncbi:hypothetical protein M422DRAFT_186788, partial [Sphaerobolus stellatus SS14]